MSTHAALPRRAQEDGRPVHAQRFLAAAAHLAVLLSNLGLVVPAALFAWASLRQAGELARQAREAFLYQAAVAAVVACLGWLGVRASPVGWLVGVLHLAAMAYGSYGAFAALDGRPFRYLPRA